MTVFRISCAVALVLSVGVAGLLGQTEPQQLTLASLIERYDRGDQTVVPELAAHFDKSPTESANLARAWIDGRLEETARRRLVIATAVLESALLIVEAEQERRMLSDVHFHDDKDWVRRWRLFRTLIEWACDLVRSSSNPGSVERAWFAASFELLELAQDRTFLYGIEPGATPERVLSIDDEYRGNVNHLAHGLGRFPDNPTFRLLRLEGHADLWEGVAYWIATETTVPASSLDAMQGQAAAIRARRNRREGPRHPSDMDIVRRAEFLAELLKARERIQSFQLVQEVAARIHLDLGLIALCLGDRALGLTELSKADAAAGDDKLKFLSRFLQGRIHGRQGQTALSEAAYRSALTLRPDSQSAVVALAEILFTDGRRREAVELADRAVALKRLSEHRLRPRDPWLEFFEHGRLTSEQPFLGLRRALFQ